MFLLTVKGYVPPSIVRVFVAAGIVPPSTLKIVTTYLTVVMIRFLIENIVIINSSSIQENWRLVHIYIQREFFNQLNDLIW